MLIYIITYTVALPSNPAELTQRVTVTPFFLCVGDLVPVSAVSVARSAVVSPGVSQTLPEHLEDIVAGSHPSLGVEGRATLRNILHQFTHMFPTPGEPVTGRTTAAQHEIETNDARPVWCGPRRLAPAGLWTEQTLSRKCLRVGRLSPTIVLGLLLWYL